MSREVAIGALLPPVDHCRITPLVRRLPRREQETNIWVGDTTFPEFASPVLAWRRRSVWLWAF